jgi:hypothetical protein
MDRTWDMLMRVADRKVRAERGRINLVGYAPGDSEFAGELREVLPRLGLTLNALLVPSFRSRDAAEFARATVTVLNPARSYGFEFSRAAKSFPRMRFRSLPPPFGKNAALAFCRGLAEQGGRKDPAGEAQALWEPHEAEFAGWRERARGLGACFFVRPADAPYLLDPNELHGIDLLRVMSEFAFRSTVVVLAGEEGEPVRGRLQALVDGDGLLREQVVVTREPVSRMREVLGALDVRLCFTEFPPDRRVLEARKMFFQPRDFQPGLSGAVRSLMKLVRLAQSGFPPLWSGLAGPEPDRAPPGGRAAESLRGRPRPNRTLEGAADPGLDRKDRRRCP